MLSYAFRVLREVQYEEIQAEEFDYTADLLAAILAKGLQNQIKRGLGKGYVPIRDVGTCPRGKIDISASIKANTMMMGKLVYDYDSYEENTYLNQVLKSTALMFLRSKEVKEPRKKELKRVLSFLSEVDEVPLKAVRWDAFQYDRNNATYRMLINICELAVKGLLLSDQPGNTRLAKYIDDRQMHNLYEKFVLEYFKVNYPEFKVSASYIDWNLDDNFDYLLPKMKTDIMIEFKGSTTIIDAKYYSRILQYNSMFHSQSLHSNNLYQIYTYVKNVDRNHTGSVSGVLLYAKPDGEKPINTTYRMDGNTISIKTLDLEQDFEGIKATLDGMADDIRGYGL